MKKILAELEGLAAAAKELQDPLSGTLFVGATPLVPHSGLFDALSKLAGSNPSLKLSFVEGGEHRVG